MVGISFILALQPICWIGQQKPGEISDAPGSRSNGENNEVRGAGRGGGCHAQGIKIVSLGRKFIICGLCGIFAMDDAIPDAAFVGGDPEPPSGSGLSGLSGLTEALGGLDPPSQQTDPFIGLSFDDVRILDVIAEGGMGRVYKGFQQEPRRFVALKVMRPGCVTREIRRRFEKEMAVLGRLNHPCIARIYSAGIGQVAGMQVPYFVMEYIQGALKITRFANEHGMTFQEKLVLFRKVCEAVAHAHHTRVIHRDLKPSNILVGLDGIPKVIDFGAARSVAEATEKTTALTEVGQCIGTVQYMSPEQLTGDGTPLDVRSDVYALGLILHELLAGAPPYNLRGKPLPEAARVVSNYLAAPPRILHGGIHRHADTIIKTCLQRERVNRYASAFELAQAVESCLQCEAIPNGSFPGPVVADDDAAVSHGDAAEASGAMRCPYCERLFLVTGAARGRKIRCRGCRQVFRVPKQITTAFGESTGSKMASRGSHDRCPVAVPCVIDGQDARRCPTCGRSFMMKPSLAGKIIRCRGCRAEYKVVPGA